MSSQNKNSGSYMRIDSGGKNVARDGFQRGHCVVTNHGGTFAWGMTAKPQIDLMESYRISRQAATHFVIRRGLGGSTARYRIAG